MTLTMKHALGAVVAPFALTLAACGSSPDTAEDPDGMVEDMNDTLAGVLGASDDHDQLLQAIEAAGLVSVFDGAGSYTVLAPDDDAFEALGAERDALMSEEQRPLLVGLLRDHILPGHLTRQSISDAIAQNNGEVTMTTLGGSIVTFTTDGADIVVSNETGSDALISSAGLAANNGTVLPLDGVLLPQGG